MDGETLRLGVLTPHAAAGPEEEFPVMAPGRLVTTVVRVDAAADLTGGPAAPATARRLTEPPLLDGAAERLATADAVRAIGFASTSTGYALGLDSESALVDRLSRRAGVPVGSTAPAAVRALRVLGAERVALVHPPWFDEDVNARGAEYFRGAGLEVVSSASAAGLVPDPRGIEAAAVVDWVSRHVPDTAQAVYLGGNGFRTVEAVEALEAALGRPVLTANQVLLWSLLALAGATIGITGYGRLFAHPFR